MYIFNTCLEFRWILAVIIYKSLGVNSLSVNMTQENLISCYCELKGTLKINSNNNSNNKMIIIIEIIST